MATIVHEIGLQPIVCVRISQIDDVAVIFFGGQERLRGGVGDDLNWTTPLAAGSELRILGINTQPPWWSVRFQMWFASTTNGLPVIDLACEDRTIFGSLNEQLNASTIPDILYRFAGQREPEPKERDAGILVREDIPVIRLRQGMRMEVGLNRPDDYGSVTIDRIYDVGGAEVGQPIEVCRNGMRKVQDPKVNVTPWLSQPGGIARRVKIRAYNTISDPRHWSLGHTIEVFDSEGVQIQELSRNIFEEGEVNVGLAKAWAYDVEVV